MEWKKIQLGELIDYKSGLWEGKEGKFTRAKVIRSTEIKDNGFYDLSTAKELQVEVRKLETRRVIPDSILLERSGGGENKPVGRVIFFRDDVCEDVYSFSNFTTLLLPDKNIVYSKYLFYCLYLFHLSGNTKILQKAVTGIRNLEFNKYLQQEIPIPFTNDKPDTTEQKRIADNIDSIFSEIEKSLVTLESEYDHAIDLKQSLLAKIFSTTNWKVQKLSDIVDVNPRKDFENLKPSDQVSFIPMADIDELTGTVLGKQVRSLSVVSKGYTFFKDNDVIFAKITPCMENGKCAVVKNLFNGVGFGSTEFYVLRVKPNILPEYIWHFFRQERVREEAAQHFTGAAGHKRVPKDFIENLPIPIPYKGDKPDLIEQRRVVDELNDVLVFNERVTSLIGKQNILFYDLRASVLTDAFTLKIKEVSIVSPIQSPRMFDIQQSVAIILQQIERGEMVVAKMLYLGQAIYQIPLNIQFSAQNFGPYDSVVKKAVTAGLSSRNKFFIKKGTGGMQVLALGPSADKILKYSNSSLGKKVKHYLDEMMPLFNQVDSAAIERLATICKIIEDNQTDDVNIVKQKLQEWKPGKFSDQETNKTLAFLKSKGWDKVLIKQ